MLVNKYFKLVFITLIYLNLCSCMSNSGLFQSARTLKSKNSSYALGLHLAQERDIKMPLHKKFKQFSSSYNPEVTTTHMGISTALRYGLRDKLDIGTNISLGISSVDLKLNVLELANFASAIDLKYSTPTFSILIPNLHFYTFSILNSYNINESMLMYSAVSIVSMPNLKKAKSYAGITLGGMLLDNNIGLIFEWSYYNLISKQTTNQLNSSQEYKIGFIRSTRKLHNTNSTLNLVTPSKIIALPSFGLLLSEQNIPQPALNANFMYVSSNNRIDSISISIQQAAGALNKNIKTTKEGYSTTRILTGSVNINTTSNFTPNIGISYSESFITLKDSNGWSQVHSKKTNLYLGITQKLKSGAIKWAAIHVPITKLNNNFGVKKISRYNTLKDNNYTFIAEKMKSSILVKLLEYQHYF